MWQSILDFIFPGAASESSASESEYYYARNGNKTFGMKNPMPTREKVPTSSDSENAANNLPLANQPQSMFSDASYPRGMPNRIDHSPNATTQFPDREAFLMRLADSRVNPKPQKTNPKWTSRKNYWQAKHETVNNLYGDIGRGEAYSYDVAQATRDKAFDRVLFQMKPERSGRDALGNPVGGAESQFLEVKPYGLDAYLQQPSQRKMFERYYDTEAHLPTAGNKEFGPSRGIPNVTANFPGAPGVPGKTMVGIQDYHKKLALNIPGTYSGKVFQNNYQENPTSAHGMLAIRQTDRTMIGATPNFQPQQVSSAEDPMRHAYGYENRRKRSPEYLPARVGNFAGMWTAGDPFRVSSSEDHTRHQKKGTGMMNPVPNPNGNENLSAGPSPSIDMRQVDRTVYNTRYPNLNPVDSYNFYQHSFGQQRTGKKLSSMLEPPPAFGLNFGASNFGALMSRIANPGASRAKYLTNDPEPERQPVRV